uniref:Ig-like domain-containing protein n=1 Tax=Takifugu rubripes TaxID=31033 RepID=A0A674MX33_TAKRU
MAPRVFKGFFLNVIFCLVAAQSIKYGLKGQEVKLKPQIQEQQPDLILWMHDDNKVVEFNGKEEDVYDPFKHRTTLDRHSAELHLTDLRSEDSGLYELQLYMQKKPYSYYYTLQVIDKVAKPTIICETNSSKSSNLSGLLTCSAPQPDIEYEWFFYGNTQPGPQLRIFLDNKHDERVYSCRVSNPLSNETAEFTAKDCYSDESSSVDLAAVLSAVVLLVLVLAGVVIYRRCYKGGANQTEGESQLPLKSHIKEGESQVQDEAPKQGIIRRLRDKFQRFGAQQTPANSHRNHRDFCPQSQQKRPRQGQKGSDEDDEGDEGTELDTELVSDEPDPAEKEASDLESSTEQTASEKENKEQFIHSAGEDREVGSAQVIKEPDSSSTEADQSVDNSSGEADKSDIQINLTSFHTGAVSRVISSHPSQNQRREPDQQFLQEKQNKTKLQAIMMTKNKSRM